MQEKIGHYTIVSRLGRGGMGVVYKAHEGSLNRYVAIKVLADHLVEDPQFLTRFVREAQSAASLSHPNIVQIFYIGEDGGQHFFVMEYVSGKPLDLVIRERGRIDSTHASQVILQAAHGLAAAHDKGVIHRDIKPANLMLDERGMVKIADFGLALPTESQAKLTATGMLMGTPGYLAPEQCRGEQADHRTDIYALGVSWYEMLTGSTPFHAESPLLLLRQILEEDPPEVSTLNPEVDQEVRRILTKMIAKEPADRYQSAHELIVDLEEDLAARGVRTATKGLAALTAAVAASGAEPNADATVALSDPATPTAQVPASPTTPVESPSGSSVQATSSQPAAVTVPPIASAEPVTVVPQQPPAAYAPVQEAAQIKSGSSAGKIFAIIAVVVLLLGGAVAAAGWYGFKTFFGDRETLIANLPGSDLEVAESGVFGDGENLLELAAPILTGDRKKENSTEPTATETAPAEPIAAEPRKIAQSPSSAQATASPSSTNLTASPTPTTKRTEPSPVLERAPAVAAPVDRAPARSGVAVAVTGDPALVGPISSVLSSKLSGAGIDVVDASVLPSTESLLRSDPSAARLIETLGGEGLRMLLLARVDPTGERQLNYMGRSETAYSSRITVTLYDLATGRPVGQPQASSIEYTTRSADREAEKAVGRIGRTAADRIRSNR
jgi:eukaryotic-like serine/threonine-protein kinase